MSSKDKGSSQTVSYACSYVPEEIIIAAGLAPRRIIPDRPPSEADAYMHPNTCYYLKSLLASSLAGQARETDGIVFANSCDGMRRLHDIWNEYVEDAPALFLDVPKKKDDASIDFFASELRRLASRLGSDIGVTEVTSERLNDAIGACNNIRRLMNEAFKLQRGPRSDVPGLSIFGLCMEAASSNPSELVKKLELFISSAGQEQTSDSRRRIMVTGNVILRPDLIKIIENSGGRVVALDTCTGIRQFDTLVEENSHDPFEALAKRYLLKPPCARMEGIDERSRYLEELAGDCGAEGIVYSSVKFCDYFLYDVPTIQGRFKEAGIPFIFIENDYEWGGIEQMKTRVEAFLAMLGERGASQNV